MTKNKNDCSCESESTYSTSEHFPAMSAHFAHTLDDMNEKYLQAQFINIDTRTGVFNCHALNKLLSSRSNMIVYKGRIFRFMARRDDLYKYLNFYSKDNEKVFRGEQVTVNSSTGYWQVEPLDTSDKETIESLTQNITVIENNITEINNNISSLDDKLDKAIDDVEESFSQVSDQIDVLTENIDKNKEDISSLNSDLADVNKELDEINTSISDINARVDDLGDELNMDGGEVVLPEGI